MKQPGVSSRRLGDTVLIEAAWSRVRRRAATVVRWESVRIRVLGKHIP